MLQSRAQFEQAPSNSNVKSPRFAKIPYRSNAGRTLSTERFHSEHRSTVAHLSFPTYPPVPAQLTQKEHHGPWIRPNVTKYGPLRRSNTVPIRICARVSRLTIQHRFRPLCAWYTTRSRKRKSYVNCVIAFSARNVNALLFLIRSRTTRKRIVSGNGPSRIG